RMPYVQRYNVLIASPSDAERDEVFRAIAAWNGSVGGVDRRVVFVPLMWEKHAIAEADKAPQAAINEQLLDRADLVLAVFSSRFGTPTDDYPAGTVEELSRRKGRAAVFFLDTPRLDPNAPDGIEQLKRLMEFRRGFSGFARTYKENDDLAAKVRDQLDGWSRQLDTEGGIPLVARPAPWTADGFMGFLEGQDKPVNLLFFNVELASFRSPDVFAERWAFVNEFASIKRVVFLLPEYKVHRLRRLLPALVNGGQETLLQRFHVCPQKERSSSARDRVSSSLAFVLACHGRDIDETGDYLPVADLAILSEPFSSANYQDGDPDIQWDYNYCLSVNANAILTTLRRIWREWYEESRAMPMLNLLTQSTDENDVERALDHLKETASRGLLKNDEAYQLITQLRAKLFDPNVPSYLLNNLFELLDWNPAFELIFPTNRFYRNMSVKEFVECLDNSADVKRRGLELVDSAVPLDMEELRYTSPVYGKMRFTKIASRVVDPMTQETCGWIVALNVNDAEHWQVYEDDLKRTNEEQSLIGLYALSAERVLGQFPGYRALVDAHVEAMRRARRVLDLGSGPGFLAAKLLAAGMAVTSIDINDAMIEITRRRCGAFPGFSAVKANVERLHAPNEFYDMTKIGISRLYDGACMLNLYQWLRDPVAVLHRLVQDKLLSPGAVVTISLLCGKGEIEELFRALNYLKQVEQARQASCKRSFDLWEPMDFDRFSTVMRQFIARGMAKLSPDVVLGHLNAARYRVLDQHRVGYEIDGQRYEGFPFIIAEAPHE
ncbi:MAG: methyltransferase domain-containing protein, partial [Rhodoplanes sp.]